MKKVLLILMVLTVAFTSVSAFAFTSITPGEAYNMVVSGPNVYILDVRTTEDKFITNRSSANKQAYHALAPGIYYFRLNTITVHDVPIEKGKETRIKAGILSIVSEGRWEIRSEEKQKFHTSGNKPKKIALPIGNYQLKLGEQFFPIVIRDNKTVEM